MTRAWRGILPSLFCRGGQGWRRGSGGVTSFFIGCVYLSVFSVLSVLCAIALLSALVRRVPTVPSLVLGIYVLNRTARRLLCYQYITINRYQASQAQARTATAHRVVFLSLSIRRKSVVLFSFWKVLSFESKRAIASVIPARNNRYPIRSSSDVLCFFMTVSASRRGRPAAEHQSSRPASSWAVEGGRRGFRRPLMLGSPNRTVYSTPWSL